MEPLGIPVIETLTIAGFGVNVKPGDEFTIVRTDIGDAIDVTAISSTNAADEIHVRVRQRRRLNEQTDRSSMV
jgi:hypothetical protein